jgi:hypothetical protein
MIRLMPPEVFRYNPGIDQGFAEPACEGNPDAITNAVSPGSHPRP